MNVTIDVAIGELFDRLSILNIKQMMIDDQLKLNYVTEEKKLLEEKLRNLGLNDQKVKKFLTEIQEINLKLWKIEDDIRLREKANDFGKEFVQLARSVYITNDLRFEVKNKINTEFGSSIREVKFIRTI